MPIVRHPVPIELHKLHDLHKVELHEIHDLHAAQAAQPVNWTTLVPTLSTWAAKSPGRSLHRGLRTSRTLQPSRRRFNVARNLRRSSSSGN